MWERDPTIWDGISPILFPVVGWCSNGQIKSGGRAYPMPVHGFAASSRFEIKEQAENRAVFVLQDNEKTRLHYPFAFRLTVTYCVSPEKLDIVLDIHNNGEEPLPYACGVHPGFALPACGDADGACFLTFEKIEDPMVPEISDTGLFRQARRAVPISGKNLPVNSPLFEQEALCFLDARSRSMHLVQGGFATGSRHAIRLAVDGFPHLAVWSKPHAPFVCMEAWTGHGDREGFDGDIQSKPGMIQLPSGDTGTHRASLVFIPSWAQTNL